MLIDLQGGKFDTPALEQGGINFNLLAGLVFVDIQKCGKNQGCSLAEMRMATDVTR